MSKETRFIIGQTEQAGLPISAPAKADIETNLRWRKKADTFVLEQYVQRVYGGGLWVEIPCVDLP